MLNRTQLAWAAGLFEGEGCFTSGARSYAEARLSMADEDRVRLFRDAIGFGSVTWVRPQRAHWKPMWKWRAGGFEEVQAVAALLWPWLGPRRRQQASAAVVSHRRHVARRLEAERPCETCGRSMRPGPLAMHRKACR